MQSYSERGRAKIPCVGAFLFLWELTGFPSVHGQLESGMRSPVYKEMFRETQCQVFVAENRRAVLVLKNQLFVLELTPKSKPVPWPSKPSMKDPQYVP